MLDASPTSHKTPSPADIAAGAAEVRARWSDEEYYERAGAVINPPAMLRIGPGIDPESELTLDAVAEPVESDQSPRVSATGTKRRPQPKTKPHQCEKISDAGVRSMRRLRARLAVSWSELAAIYGLNPKTCYRICTGQHRVEAGGPIVAPGPIGGIVKTGEFCGTTPSLKPPFDVSMVIRCPTCGARVHPPCMLCSPPPPQELQS